MKITKRQLKRLLDEARNGPVTEAAPPGTIDYSARAVGERAADAAYEVIDDYIAWHARQGILDNVIDEILNDSVEIAKTAANEIEMNIAMALELAASEQGMTEAFEPDDQEEYDATEYDRGYQDGLDAYPVADDATPDYDAGYEDGKLDAGLPEIPYDEARSEDW